MRTSPAHLLPPQLQEARSIIIHILLIRKLRLKEVDRLAADHKQQFFKISHIHGNMLSNFENMSQMTQNNYTLVRHPTPVLLPGKSHGWRNLVGCSPWGR